jgi:hypothetical protein
MCCCIVELTSDCDERDFRLQVRDFFGDTLGMTGQLLDDVVKGVTKDDATLLTFMRKVA